MLPGNTQSRRLIINAFFGFLISARHMAQPNKKTTSVSKNQLFFLTHPFLLRQNRQVKKGGIVETPPLENTCHASHGDTWHALSSGPSSSGFSYKIHGARFSYLDCLKEGQTTHICINIRTAFTIHPDDQHRSSGYDCPGH